LLIIFDLDDTLIDTSRCITPVKLVDALHRICDAGLLLSDISAAERMIKQMDETKGSAKETLIEFLEIHGADKKYLEIGLKEIYENSSLEMPISPVEGALELLRDLEQAHQLALVTLGIPDRQLIKMKKAGIDPTLFCKIIVEENQNKKIHYQALAQEMNVLSSEVVVCGDRIALDLSPAKELGFNTIHVRRGRGVHSRGAMGDVDFTVTHLNEIKDVIKNVASG
jgi:FMN phosphatase YigB (HAD superfamily)